MTLRVTDAELFGVTESSATLTFVVEDDAGPVDAPARVLVDGREAALSEGRAGTRHVSLRNLTAGTRHRIAVAAGDASAEHDERFPDGFETLPASEATEVASFATMNDLHFGEVRFGGTIDARGDYGDDAPGFPSVHADSTDVPYWKFMNEDALDEIDASGVDCAIIKGDIADRGRSEQFAAAADAFSRLSVPHHAFLGNHDYYALEIGEEVDGYALLGQPRAPRTVDLGGWRLVLLETVEPGHHHGVFGDERLRWLEGALDEAAELALPTLLFMHHQPVPAEHAHRYPNTIGIEPGDSLRLYELLGSHPQVRGVLIGHTHRNRVRRHPSAGDVPFIEVNCTKDYPGGWAHYRLYDDGSFRQEVRRTASERALAHSTLCRDFFNGGYRQFALGSIGDRCFARSGFGEDRR